MKRGRLPWFWAILITLVAVAFQRTVGPTRPVSGHAQVGPSTVRYRLPRSHGGSDNCTISLAVPDTAMLGWLVYRRYKTNDPWFNQAMEREKGRLIGRLPPEPPGGKVVYRIILGPPEEVVGGAAPSIRSTRIVVPPSGPVVLRFRGAVPAPIMIAHILLMFLGMLWANRAGVEALRGDCAARSYTLLALALLTVGGLALGPAVQWYSFGRAWTGFPYGMDLTDNKTLIAVLFWIPPAIALLRRRGSAGRGESAGPGVTAGHGDAAAARALVLLAALVTLAVFAIPHSVAGTELDYSKAPARGSISTQSSGQTPAHSPHP